MGGSEPCLAWCSLSLDNHTSDTSDCGEVHGTNTVPTLTPTTACCLPGLVLSSMLCLTSVYNQPSFAVITLFHVSRNKVTPLRSMIHKTKL